MMTLNNYNIDNASGTRSVNKAGLKVPYIYLTRTADIAKPKQYQPSTKKMPTTTTKETILCLIITQAK